MCLIKYDRWGGTHNPCRAESSHLFGSIGKEIDEKCHKLSLQKSINVDTTSQDARP